MEGALLRRRGEVRGEEEREIGVRSEEEMIGCGAD